MIVHGTAQAATPGTSHNRNVTVMGVVKEMLSYDRGGAVIINRLAQVLPLTHFSKAIAKKLQVQQEAN